MRERIARSVSSRIATALKIADDETRERETRLRAEIAYIVEEVRRSQEEFTRIQEQAIRDLEERINADLAVTSGSVGNVSSQLTDAQRRQSEILERLVRRVRILEESSGSKLPATPPS